MRLEKADYEIIEQKSGKHGIYDMAEFAGRLCKHSLDKKTANSAETFCKGLIKAGHGGALEHATVYLKTGDKEVKNSLYVKYKANPYSKAHFVMLGNKKVLFVTTNLRVILENHWVSDLQYLCDITEHHKRRVTVLFDLDRFTGEEFIRHRRSSLCRESSRYVNFFKDKFGGGSISFILPPWLYYDGFENRMTDRRYRQMCLLFAINGTFLEKARRFFKIITGKADKADFTERELWEWTLMSTERSYNAFIGCGWQPQQARTVLPCAIKSPLLMTAFVSDWVHFFNLRSDIAATGQPHPQAEELATPLRDEFITRGYITDGLLNKECVLQSL